MIIRCNVQYNIGMWILVDLPNVFANSTQLKLKHRAESNNAANCLKISSSFSSNKNNIASK